MDLVPLNSKRKVSSYINSMDETELYEQDTQMFKRALSH
jgi:hypothetical protein